MNYLVNRGISEDIVGTKNSLNENITFSVRSVGSVVVLLLKHIFYTQSMFPAPFSEVLFTHNLSQGYARFTRLPWDTFQHPHPGVSLRRHHFLDQLKGYL